MTGCTRQQLGTALAGAASGSPGGTAYAPPKLMLFGGDNHKTYLGCLNCSEYATDSIFNEYGHNGSPYSSESIWNHFSQFGSSFSQFSACGEFASDPPVIVDREGRYYGRLTTNEFHYQLGSGSQYLQWLKEKVCKD